MSTYQEHVHTFGEGDVLLGIATVPADLDPKRPAVVLMNAGLVHRVGPFRLHVELARQLAARGTLVLRIDQSALGDSADRPGGLSYEERAVLDARESMDFLTKRYETSRFVVAGLCAGAMNTHRVMVADERVVGACLLDGYAYRTPSFARRRLLPRLVNPKNWTTRLTRLRDKLTRTTPPTETGGAPPKDAPGADAAAIFEQEWPPQDEVKRELETVLARGTSLLFVYTGGWSDYIHEAQFDEMFPGRNARGSVRVRFFRDADHTYVLVDHRKALLDEVTSFVSSVR